MGSLQRSAGGEKAALVESVDADAACALLSMGQYGYVDVRMWEDFDGGHVAGARNVPYYLSVTPHGRPEKNGRFVDQVAALHGKEDCLIVGCRSGVRSRLAAADLVDAVSFITLYIYTYLVGDVDFELLFCCRRGLRT